MSRRFPYASSISSSAPSDAEPAAAADGHVRTKPHSRRKRRRRRAATADSASIEELQVTFEGQEYRLTDLSESTTCRDVLLALLRHRGIDATSTEASGRYEMLAETRPPPEGRLKRVRGHLPAIRVAALLRRRCGDSGRLRVRPRRAKPSQPPSGVISEEVVIRDWMRRLNLAVDQLAAAAASAASSSTPAVAPAASDCGSDSGVGSAEIATSWTVDCEPVGDIVYYATLV